MQPIPCTSAYFGTMCSILKINACMYNYVLSIQNVLSIQKAGVSFKVSVYACEKGIQYWYSPTHDKGVDLLSGSAPFIKVWSLKAICTQKELNETASSSFKQLHEIDTLGSVQARCIESPFIPSSMRYRFTGYSWQIDAARNSRAPLDLRWAKSPLCNYAVQREVIGEDHSAKHHEKCIRVCQLRKTHSSGAGHDEVTDKPRKGLKAAMTRLPNSWWLCPRTGATAATAMFSKQETTAMTVPNWTVFHCIPGTPHACPERLYFWTATPQRKASTKEVKTKVLWSLAIVFNDSTSNCERFLTKERAGWTQFTV